MFDLSQVALFLLATVTLNITPGPDMLYCAARTLGQGKRAGIASALGISTGCLVHTLAAALGVSAILSYSAITFLIIKYLGAAYLIYLGIKTFRSKSPMGINRDIAPVSTAKIFWQGVVTNVLNPKVALFFLSFLPQFVHPERGSVALQITALGLMFITSGTIVLIAMILIVGRAGRWLEARPAFVRAQKWFTGSVFIALGARLALADRK